MNLEKQVTTKQESSLRPVQKRLLIPLAGVFIILLLGFSTALILAQKNNLNQSSRQVLEDSFNELSILLAEQSGSLTALIKVIVRDEALRQGLKKQDRQSLHANYAEIFAQLREDHKITHFYFHRTDRTNLLRVHKPEKHGDLIDRFTALEAERTGKIASGIELGPLGTFTLRAVMPVLENNSLIGYVELGKEIEDTLSTIHSKYGVECFVAIRKEFLNRAEWELGMAMLGRKADWPRYKNHVKIYQSLPACVSVCGEFIGEAKPQYNVPVETTFDGKFWHVVAQPLQDASGAEVGDLFLLHDISQQKAFFKRLIMVMSGGTLAVFVILFSYLFIVLKKTDQGILAQQNILIRSKDQIQKYIKAIDDMGLGLLIIDKNFRVCEVNNTIKSWFGSYEGKPCYQGISGSDSPCSYCRIDDVIKAGKTVHFQTTISDGRIFDIVSTPLSNPDGTISMMEILNDITERKRTEQQLQKMEKLESVGILAGGIAHDFNNILAGIFGNIALAKRKLDNEHPACMSLDQAEKSLSRATNLTTKLLTFAKGGEPIIEHVNLGEIINDVVEFDLSGSNVKLLFQQPDDIWVAEVDKGQVQQIFSNLTRNAQQAMFEGGHLYVSLQNIFLQNSDNLVCGTVSLRPGKYIKVSVRDEGTGIEQKLLQKIFDPYFSTKQAGHGLGLATVHSIINKHNGHISVQSEIGKGTTFTLYLPATEREPLKGLQEEDHENPGIKFPAKVLVMDDEEIVRMLTTEILEDFGCTVETAINGEEALMKYQRALDDKGAFDLVVLDLTIPGGMGGKEVAQKLLQIDTQAKLIVSSGYAENSIMAHYSEYGFKGVVTKPFTIRSLQDVVEKVITL